VPREVPKMHFPRPHHQNLKVQEQQ
jgi:hypothetical protein